MGTRRAPPKELLMQVHSSLEDFVKDAERFCPLAGIIRLTRPFQKCILYSSRFSFIIIYQSKTDKASIMACVRRDTPCPAGLGELRHFSESYGREQNAEHQKDH